MSRALAFVFAVLALIACVSAGESAADDRHYIFTMNREATMDQRSAVEARLHELVLARGFQIEEVIEEDIEDAEGTLYPAFIAPVHKVDSIRVGGMAGVKSVQESEFEWEDER